MIIINSYLLLLYLYKILYIIVLHFYYKSPILVEMTCKIYVLHYSISDYHISFFT